MVHKMIKSRFEKSLIGGSLVLLITVNIFNFLNFVYNISMARLLSLADYGKLTTLIYFIVIFAVFNETIQLVISKYSTSEDSEGKIKNIIKKSFRRASKISLIFYIIFLVISIFISSFLEIEFPLLALTGLMIFASFFLPITRGVMQGKKKFSSLGWNMASEGAIKFIAAILLVLVGFGVYGALFGIVLGSAGALVLSRLNLRNILSFREEPSSTPKIHSYIIPVFIVMLVIVLFLSLDVILARLFFEPEIVGIYAISSTIAKIIFIGTQPISKAMFPFTSESEKKKESYKSFIGSLKIIGILIAVALILVFLFSNLIIRLYAGRFVAPAAGILFYLAIAMGLLSFTNLILFYNLATKKTKHFWILFIFVLIEIVLLSLFHENLFQFSLALVTAAATFLWGAVMLLNR